MPAITHDVARQLLDRAMEKATQDFRRPICAAVCDPQGFLVAFVRMDGAPVRSVAISQGKAYSAARMGVTTEAFHARLQREQIDIRYFCDPQLTALAGGSVLKDADGTIAGAVGVSGLTSAEDQQITDFVAGQFLRGKVRLTMRPLLLVAGLFAANSAFAQLNQAITDAELYDPWTLARAFAVSLPVDGPKAVDTDADKRAGDARRLDESLAVLRVRFEEIAISIVAKPEFSYDAAQASLEMSQEVGQAATAFNAWLEGCPADQRAQAGPAQQALEKLRAILAQRSVFERDVLLAIGSGSKHAIQALSRRWWTASERVEELRLAVAPAVR